MEIARYAALGYAQLTGMSAATTFASASVTIPAGTTHILMRAETQNVRWRDDGVAPTGTVGNLLATGDGAFLYGGPASKLQFIQATSGAILNVSFYSVTS